MKHFLTPLALAFAVAVSPAAALTVDMNGLTPPLDFPKPAPEQPSQDVTGIDK